MTSDAAASAARTVATVAADADDDQEALLIGSPRHRGAGIVLIACLLQGIPAHAQGPAAWTPSRHGCLVGPSELAPDGDGNGDGDGDADAEAEDVWLSALRIATRKVDLRMSWTRAGRPADCPGGQPVVSLDGLHRAVVTAPGVNRRELDLSQASPETRPRALAHAVLVALTEATGGDPAPLMDADDEIVLGGPPPGHRVPAVPAVASRSEPPDRSLALAWVGRLGGTWLHQLGASRQLVGPALELGVSLYDERLAFSVAGAYTLGGEVVTAGVSTDLWSVELLGMARGGVGFGSFVLRAGLGAGWQRRAVSAESDRQVGGAVTEDSDAAVAAGDLELLWRLSDRWDVGLLLGARRYLGGAEHRWLGEVVYERPTWAAGGRLALGATL